jgi:crotonobetainyl-CoA:carnitine CoA-transferase CaiB-like acyl-CoA transferase
LAFLQSDQYWNSFCVATGKEELKEDPRFKSHQKREENNEALIGLITETFSKKTLEEWERTLNQYKMPYESARSIKEIVNDPQAIENDFFHEVEHLTSKHLKLVNSPVKFSETPAEIRRTAPELGQHTEEILLDLNYSWEDISELREQAVISSCDLRDQRENDD